MKFLYTLMLVCGLFFIPQSAQSAPAHHGHDTRPCVSLAEVRGIDLNHPSKSLGYVEQRWDVVGQRVQDFFAPGNNPGGYLVFVYHACGYHEDEVELYLITEPRAHAIAHGRPHLRDCIVVTVERLRNVTVGTHGGVHNR